jgi:hypothetical protein
MCHGNCLEMAIFLKYLVHNLALSLFIRIRQVQLNFWGLVLMQKNVFWGFCVNWTSKVAHFCRFFAFLRKKMRTKQTKA